MLLGSPLAVADDDPYARFMAKSEPLAADVQARRFRVPPGFVVELVAAEPNVRKPINMAFDAAGRLFVTGSVEYPQPVGPERKPRDAIYRLADTNGDGTFDQTTTFAGGLNLPMGVATIPGGVIGYSIPTVDRFSDTNGDGRADQRRTLLRGFAYDDTHGMVSSLTPWIDGWVYACHGEGNVSRVTGTDGHTITLRGGNTFRFRPDGSRVEIFSHGQANPFGLAFDPLGNLFSADSHSRPAMLLLRGGWYPGIGSHHDGLGLAPVIMDHYHGSTGIAGIAFYADDVFPPPYRGTLFIGNPSTGRINHDALEARGSTYRAVECPDFLTCDDPWFRPVDLKLGPDGALYIADFYDRVIAHNVVPPGHTGRDRERGRIWRVRYVGDVPASKTSARRAADLSKADLPALIDHLRHPNLTIRTHATHEIVGRIGRAAVEPLKALVIDQSDRWQRVHGLWAVARLGGLDDKLLDRLTRDAEPVVRLHAVKALAESGDWDAQSGRRYALVHAKLTDVDAFVRRAAADVLGRHPSESNLRLLLDAWSKAAPDDTRLIHTIRMAVRDNLRELAEVPKDVVATPTDARHVAEALLGLPTAASARFVLSLLQSNNADPARRSSLLFHAARYLSAGELTALYEYARSFQKQSSEAQGQILRAVYRAAQERQSDVPADIADWAVATARKLLASGDELSVGEGIELAWSLRLTQLAATIKPLALRQSAYPELRTLAIDALAGIDPRGSIELLDTFLADATEPVDIREKAADALAKIPNKPARDVLLAHLPRAPSSLALSIGRHLSHRRDGAAALLDAIDRGHAPPRLLLDPQLDQQLRDSGLANVDSRLADLRRGLPPADDRLEKSIARLAAGFQSARADATRGADVFKKHCAICHAAAGQGATLGPTLDGIGGRGVERLLEDLLNPSLNLDPKYRATLVATKDGATHTVLMLSDDGDTVVFAGQDGKPIRLPASQIERRKTLNVSPMPAADRLAENDLYDLIAHLLAQKR
jgi:putative heme-binding domain-containing protein